MKTKIVSWIRLLIILMILIQVIGAVIILHSLRSDDPLLIHIFHANIRNTVYIGTFFFFFLAVTMFFFLPVYLKRIMQILITILRDWKNDAYDVDLDLEGKKKTLDKQVYDVVYQMSETRDLIQSFRNKRKKKITEHYNRIVSMLRIVKEGVMILDIRGNIIFINDILVEVFPQLENNQNLLENSYPVEIENNLKKLVQVSLQKHKRQEAVQCFIPNLKRHITIDSALVRDQAGEVNGIVVAVQNLEKKKPEKKDKETETNNQ